MDSFVSVLSGVLILVSTVVAWIIAYKRIRDDWLHSLLIFTGSLTIIMASGHPWETLTGALPWELYASGVSVPISWAATYSIIALVVVPLYVEVMWWVACLLRLIAHHVPTPKQP